MALKQRIKEDLVSALKNKDVARRTVLRSVLTAIQNAEIEQGSELDEPGITRVLRKQLKQRRESASAYADRPDLAEAEETEAAVIEGYLPEPMSDEDLRALVDRAISETGATGLSDMGKVMQRVSADARDRADPGRVAGLVKSRLG